MALALFINILLLGVAVNFYFGKITPALWCAGENG
ncbi:hypothetical protein MFFDBJGM_00910 [Pectobacterium versatile]|nr:Hypothetical protein SCC1_3614 [Pectobacterium versatile]MBK4824688.1 hypothetical protein [Pectobacterium carotovorum subsp. carotovorum]PVY72046.1 hypothetical protein C7330_1087 [Pectobacterium versatile]GBO47902.1 hypothetical protein MFFDBJGM_00910 [Pectobacterium versatile]